MISLLLIKKIIPLYLIMFIGFLLVKTGKLHVKDSKILTVVAVFVIFPCSILTSFNAQLTNEMMRGIIVNAIAAAIIYVALILCTSMLRKPLKLTKEEHASIVYSNAGGFAIPIISSMMGAEYVIYCCPYIALSFLLMWSHAKSIICGDSGLEIKKILLNINILAIIIGTTMLCTGLKFPSPIQDAVNGLGGMVGPVNMLVAGMLVAGINVKDVFKYKRLPFVIIMRLIIFPVLLIALFKLIGLGKLADNGSAMLMISVICLATPPANTILQLAQLYGGDADYANVISIACTLLCIVSLPIIIWLYQLV